MEQRCTRQPIKLQLRRSTPQGLNIPGATVEDYAEYQLVTNSEDIVIVESQRPEEVPLNSAAEVHIPADKLSIRYRRDLVEMFGLGAPEMVA